MNPDVSDPFKFFTPVKVRFNETDLQGHVNFGNYFFYFDAALTEYLAAVGYDFQSLLADGVDLLFAESHCNYLSPVQWPEVLNVHVRIGYLGRRSIRFEFDLRAAQDGRQAAKGHIVAVTAERRTWVEREVPERLRQAVAAYERGDDLPASQPAGN
jgi:acyl-CoA thioester hydrolase